MVIDKVDHILERIQAAGERMTISRRLVIEALGNSHHHLTIGDIQAHLHEQAPGHTLSDTTVYRILQWLKDLELISQTDMGQTGIVYALIGVPYHHHLICLSCGQTLTIDDQAFAALRERLSTDFGFTARTDHMAIYGCCRNCSQKH